MTQMFLRRASILASVFLLIWGMSLRADIIYLKSGRKIEGTVVKADADSMTIEMAMGNVTVPRSKILRIDTTEEGNQRRDTLEKASEYESEIENLKRSIASLYNAKGKLSVLSLKVKNEESEVHQYEDDLARLQKIRSVALQELEPYAQYRGRRVPDRIYDQYIAAKTRYETTTAKVESVQQSMVTARRRLVSAREVLTENRLKLAAEIKSVNHRKRQLIDRGCPEEALVSVDRALSGFDDLDLFHEIPLRREGNSFYLTVTLNEEITEEFILDTGCSTILLSPEVARRLNLRESAVLGGGSSTIADGSTMEVTNVYLQSVEVNGMRADNVAAQVSSLEGGNSPLLLGMSYLERFRFSLDAQRGILTLE